MTTASFLCQHFLDNTVPVFSVNALRRAIIGEAFHHGNSFIDDANTKIVTLQDILQQEDDMEDYNFPGILLKVTHFNHDKKEEELKNPIMGGKRQKLRNYNRIALFATLDGLLFCIVFETEQQARSAFQYCSGKITRGNLFLLIEPEKTKGTGALRKDVPTLKTS